MTCIDLTSYKKICCSTYFLTPKLKVSACSEETLRFTPDRLDYMVTTCKNQKPPLSNQNTTRGTAFRL